MRTPFLSLIAAATFAFVAGSTLAGDGVAGCPPHHHSARPVRCHCVPAVAHEAHRHALAERHGWTSGAVAEEGEYGRQNFSWAPTGPGDENPGPSMWRPGPAGRYAPPPAAYAGRGMDHRGFDGRDQGEREFSDRFAERGPGYERGHDERDMGHRYAGGGAYFGGEEYRRDGYADGRGDIHGRDFDRRAEGHGLGVREYAFGYSREEERSWSSHSMAGEGGFLGHRVRDCDERVSATDQYGFLTWPGKTHFFHHEAMGEAPMGPPPGGDDPQAPIIVHP